MGIEGFINRMKTGKSLSKTCRRDYEEEVLRQTDPYYGWISVREKAQEPESARGIAGGPLFGVFLYQTGYMSEEEVSYCRASVQGQTYRNFQIAEGVNRFGEMERQEGDYFVFVNAKGVLASGALAAFAGAVMDGGGAQSDILYSDSDELDVAVGLSGEREAGQRQYRHNPWFKPDWSPDTLLSFCYFGELVCVRRERALAVQLLKKQDLDVVLYDFLLKATESSKRIVHIPRVLFHRWGIDEGELLRDQDRYPVRDQEKYRDIKADAYRRRGYDRLVRRVEEENPLISIVIPSRDNVSVLRCCVESVRKNTAYKNYEVIVVDNGSGQETAMDLKLLAAELGFVYLHEPMEFNYSAMNRLGVLRARGEYLLFLNDDVEAMPEDGDWLLRMARQAALPHVGAVGAKLFYPDSVLIQHAGITNLAVGPSHKLMGYPDHDSYYFGRNRMNYDVLGVTGACLLVEREKYERAGGFDEAFPVGYGDVDLCVRLLGLGYYNVVCNDVVLYHHESLSRGRDKESAEKAERLKREKEFFYSRYPQLVNADPFYNPNLIKDDITYVSDYVPEWRSRGYVSALEVWDLPLPEPEKRESFQYNLESVEEISGSSEDSLPEKMLSLEGWSCLTRADNCEFERYLVFMYNDRKCLAAASPKYREDVEQVYRDVKGVKLAGFLCRVDMKALCGLLGLEDHERFREKLGREVRTGILVKSKCNGKWHYSGDIDIA